MHHTLHKTNNILSKFLLFSPKQVKVTSDANRSRINTRIQTGKLSERPTSLSSDNRSRINTRSQTGNLIRTITGYPPITGSGSTPDAQWGNIHILSIIISSEQSARRTILTINRNHESLAYDSVALDGILSPSPTTSQHFSAFRMLHIWLKNQYKPITSFKRRAQSLTYNSLRMAS